jgi:hypothetical protein
MGEDFLSRNSKVRHRRNPGIFMTGPRQVPNYFSSPKMSTDDERQGLVTGENTLVEDREEHCLEVLESMISSDRPNPGELVWYIITATMWFMLLGRIFLTFTSCYQSHHLVLNAPCENIVALECPRANIACARISLIEIAINRTEQWEEKFLYFRRMNESDKRQLVPERYNVRIFGVRDEVCKNRGFRVD